MYLYINLCMMKIYNLKHKSFSSQFCFNKTKRELIYTIFLQVYQVCTHIKNKFMYVSVYIKIKKKRVFSI